MVTGNFCVQQLPIFAFPKKKTVISVVTDAWEKLGTEQIFNGTLNPLAYFDDRQPPQCAKPAK